MTVFWAYRFSVFLSAFLVFLLQPMMAKAVLPIFGGSYLVWGICVAFFQGLLLLGYAYAHFVQDWLGVFRYSRWHWLLLVCALFFFPFSFELLYQAHQEIPFYIKLIVLLLSTVAVPFFVLSTASLVLQRWLSVSKLPQAENPYVLYSPSNLGSILGLISYPVLIEPFLDLSQQGNLWWMGYVVLLIVFSFCFPSKKGQIPESHKEKRKSIVNIYSMILWFFLSAAGTSMLIAVTNLMTFDIAPVPFLWVFPLSIYLVTFVLLFKQKMWFPAWIQKSFNWILVLGLLLYMMGEIRLTIIPQISLVIQPIILFVVCMNCHGELAIRKPGDVENLTLFYLIMSFGGLIGSISVSWLIPIVSTSLIEYPFSFFLATIALGMAKQHGEGSDRLSFCCVRPWICIIIIGLSLIAVPWISGTIYHLESHFVFMLMAFPVILTARYLKNNLYQLSIVILIFALSLTWTEQFMLGASSVKKHRNFYGIYKIFDLNNLRYLKHGTTQHGRQYITGKKKEIPLSYYHPTTPIGEILGSKIFPELKIGMIGLGTGALAAYMGKGQEFTIYELDPDNLNIAEDYFTYLEIARKNGARLKFVFGDGRISLRNEPEHNFDMLILDAFGSGSIPVHLLTIEAIEEYFRVLKPSGLLIAHISNKILHLEPLMFSLSRKANIFAAVKSNEKNINPDADYTVWAVFCRNPDNYRVLTEKMGWHDNENKRHQLPAAWTDQYSNLLQLLF